MLSAVVEILKVAIDKADADLVDSSFYTTVYINRQRVIKTISNDIYTYLEAANKANPAIVLPDKSWIDNETKYGVDKYLKKDEYLSIFVGHGGTAIHVDFDKDKFTEIYFYAPGYGTKAGKSTTPAHTATMTALCQKVMNDFYDSVTGLKGSGISKTQFKKKVRSSDFDANLHRKPTTRAAAGTLLNLKGGGTEEYNEAGREKMEELISEDDFRRGANPTRYAQLYNLLKEEVNKDFFNQLNLGTEAAMDLENFKRSFRIKVDYLPISLQNQASTHDKKELKKLAAKHHYAISQNLIDAIKREGIDFKGSPTYREWATGNLPANLVKQIKFATDKRRKGTKLTKKGGLDLRVKANRDLMNKIVQFHKKENTKFDNRKSVRVKKSRKSGKTVASKAKSQGARVNKAKGGVRTGASPLALRELLNEALPNVVRSKMTGPPTLQYRTGRFANSARVENVTVGPRGGIGIDYTYMRNPYETFEPGNKQGSTYRDPKRLIGQSIREIATGILGRAPHSIRRT